MIILETVRAPQRMCMYLALGGDRASLSFLHCQSTGEARELTRREIINNFPSASEVTEPSVT